MTTNASPERRSVTIQLELSLVNQLLEIKREMKGRGKQFSISDVCQQALQQTINTAGNETCAPVPNHAPV